MVASRRLITMVAAISLITRSLYYIILMTSCQVIRDDWLGWMSQFTAVGALGIMLGIALLWNFGRLVLW